MSDISSTELGRQLMKPTGEIGLIVADKMNTTNNNIYDFVLTYLSLKDKDKVLEIGFGNGKLIPKFFTLNQEITFYGIDFSELMCEEAQRLNKTLVENGKLIISCQDSTNMRFENDFFDVIVTINTVYFWENIDKQLKELNRVIRKGGQLVIGYRPESSMLKLPFTKEVFKHYGSQSLRKIIESYGFDTVGEYIQTSTIKSVDGNTLDIEDICLVVEKG